MKTQTKNTAWAIIQHIVMIVYGLILPREIIAHYGSEMNGLYHSISQFLSYTILLELGVGAVISTDLYYPLSIKDKRMISAIISSGYKVFRKIALISFGYVILLIVLYPQLSGKACTSLIMALGIGTIAHYIVGIPERLLVISDQKGYLVYRLVSFSTAFNLLIQVLLIRKGYTLTIVKMIGSIVNIGQIAFLCLYVNLRYQIDRKIKYTTEPIKQKWNGIAQHLAYFVIENTDIIVVTLFTTFQEVSVYSIYFMVISGIRCIFSSVSYSIQPKLGEIRARGEQEELNRFFASFEKWYHICTVVAFCFMGSFLVPFVEAYMDGITDANYIRPFFSLLMVCAYCCQSIREPYDKLILASGHFRQTQSSYIIAAVLNIGISVIAVQALGLEGVAIGTLVAMGYHMIYMTIYDTKELLKRSRQITLKRFFGDGVIIGCFILLTSIVKIPYKEIFKSILRIIR